MDLKLILTQIFNFLQTVFFFTIEVLTLLVKCLGVWCEVIWRLFVKRPRASIRGEIALVTGGGHGIGREICLNLGRLGARVVIWDINVEGAKETASMIKNNGGRAWAYSCDVTDYEMIEATARQVKQDVGTVNCLVNNAGILNGLELTAMSAAQVKRTFDVNIIAYMYMLKVFLPDMLDVDHGYIINIASMASYVGCPYMTDYAASKYAVRGLDSALWNEIRSVYQKPNIHLTTVYPFFVATGLAWHMKTRFGKIHSPEDVAEAAIDAMLRHERSVYIPGAERFRTALIDFLPARITQMLLEFSGDSCGRHTVSD